MKDIALAVALIALLAALVVLDERRKKRDLARIERIKERRAKQERAQRLLQMPHSPSVTITADVSEFVKARLAMEKAIRGSILADEARARREHLRRRIPASRTHQRRSSR